MRRQYVANDEKVSPMCRQYVANDEQVSPMRRQSVANDEKELERARSAMVLVYIYMVTPPQDLPFSIVFQGYSTR